VQRFKNQDGLEFTASDQQSVALYEDLVSANFALAADTGKVLKTLVQADPEMIMAKCAGGYFAKMFGSPPMAARAAAAVEPLNELIAEHGATAREKQHARALANWCAGDIEAATANWEDILLDHPHDGLALRLAHYTHFYSGDGRRMRDSIARVLPAWRKGQRNYGYVLGCYAFGLEESGEYGRAELVGREAVEINAGDAWSVHAVAHIMEMQERHAEGIEWIDGLEEHWVKAGTFRYHLYWHRCLYYLERGETDTILDHYDRHISQDVESGFYLDVCNCASLLRRLEMNGIDVGDRWDALMVETRNHLQNTDLIFAALHYLIVAVAAHDTEAQDTLLASLHAAAETGTTSGRVCRDAGLELAVALVEAGRGEFAKAARRIAGVRYRMDEIGGSTAQRDLFEMLMIDAACQGDEPALARALLTDRVARKPKAAWAVDKLAAVG